MENNNVTAAAPNATISVVPVHKAPFNKMLGWFLIALVGIVGTGLVINNENANNELEVAQQKMAAADLTVKAARAEKIAATNKAAAAEINPFGTGTSATTANPLDQVKTNPFE